jgi:hypothetical protein
MQVQYLRERVAENSGILKKQIVETDELREQVNQLSEDLKLKVSQISSLETDIKRLNEANRQKDTRGWVLIIFFLIPKKKKIFQPPCRQPNTFYLPNPMIRSNIPIDTISRNGGLFIERVKWRLPQPLISFLRPIFLSVDLLRRELASQREEARMRIDQLRGVYAQLKQREDELRYVCLITFGVTF